MQKYDLNWIRERYNRGERPQYIFFWGHRPSKDGTIKKSCFSQWWLSEFTVEGRRYSCMEQYMMAQKAKLFGDEEIFEEIMRTGDQSEIKALGRKVRNFNGDIWDREKYGIVRDGNLEKFSQNPELREFLLSTADHVLVEASPYDRVWGIGMKEDEPGIEDPYSWKGENLLGFALMDVRDQILEKSKL